MIAALLASVAVVGGVYPTIAGPNNAPVLNVEKAAINKDLHAIATSREHINALSKQQYQERKSGINTTATNKALKKAKADNKLAKAYLRADKRDMVLDHQSYIHERKVAVRNDEFGLIKSRFKVEGDLTAGRASAVDKTKALVNQKQGLKDDKLALKQAKVNRNTDLLAANQKIEKVSGQNLALLKIEDAGVKVQNYALK